MEKNSSEAMLATKRSSRVAPGVKIIECVIKTAHSGFEAQSRRHQKYKTGVSVAPQKDLCLPKISFKKSVFECLLKIFK